MRTSCDQSLSVFLTEQPFLSQPFVCTDLRQPEHFWHLTSDHLGWEKMPKHGFGNDRKTQDSEGVCHYASHALDEDPKGKSHPLQKNHITFVQQPVVGFSGLFRSDHLVILSVSCVLYDVVCATVDVFDVEFLSNKKVENYRLHASSCNFRNHGRARFQRYSNSLLILIQISLSTALISSTAAPASVFFAAIPRAVLFSIPLCYSLSRL